MSFMQQVVNSKTHSDGTQDHGEGWQRCQPASLQECSMLIAACPFANTRIVNDLSYLMHTVGATSMRV
jgi:hypothetical protein